MIKSKLIIIFESLDTTQKRKFRKWLLSPSHNQHQDVINLFDFIYSKRQMTAKSISKKKVFNYLYPNKKYDDNRMRHVMSFALDVLDDFVRYSCVLKDDFLMNISLAKGYKALKLTKYAQQSLVVVQNKQEKQLVQNSTFFLQQYALEQELFEQVGMQKRTASTNLQEITSTFTTFFIINTLKYACISQTHSNLRKEAYQIPLLKAVLEEVSQGGYDTIDTVMVYYHSYWALTAVEATAHFVQLKKYLFKKDAVLDFEDLKELYLAALNYCIRKLNSGEEDFVIEALEIYKMGLESNILLDENKLSRFTYKNVTALGLRAKQFDWTALFIEQYAVYVEQPYRASYLHYNRCKLDFERGNYDKALERLTQVEFDDIFLNLDVKILLMKIYFSNQSFEVLASLLDSFSVFLGRKSKEVMSYHKENYQNIIKIAKKIMLVNHYSKKEVQQLREQIENTRPLTEKKWLLEQIF